MEKNSNNEEKKAKSLDELAPEELITKCKNLLLIAKKAKASKDEMLQENKQIKEKLLKQEEQISANEKSIEAMQELIENLTQDKLTNATLNEGFKKELSLKNSRIDELSIENESLQRQIKRLTDENESLLSECQTKDYKEEDIQLQDSLKSEIEKYKLQHEEKVKEISSLNSMIDNNSAKIKKLIQENSDLKTSLESNKLPADDIKVKYDVVIKKLKVYREKLFTIHEKAKVIKSDREVLLKMTKEYGEYIAQWQSDIGKASMRMINQIRDLSSQIKAKDEEINNLQVALSEKTSKCNTDSIKSLENEIESLNERLKTRDKQLEEERESQKKLKQAVKKTSVLDLEMEAYEKTLDDVNKKLEAKKKEVIEHEKTISIQNDTINSLKSQISSLETNLESEKAHCTEVKKNLDAQLSLMRKTEHERTETGLQLDMLNKNYESLKLQNNETKLEMAKTIGEMEKRYNALEIERNDLVKNTTFLESEVDKYKKFSSQHEKELENLRAEFASYKIRAQNVLRQNQTKDFSKEQELQDEVIFLQQSVDSFKESNEKLSNELEGLKRNYSDLVEDKARLQERCKDLLATLEKHSEEVLEESRKRNQEHEESVKAYQLQIDTLNAFYKKRIQDLEETKKLMTADYEKRISILEKASIPNPMTSSYEASLLPKTDDQKINLLDLNIMEREVEGSEDQSSQSAYNFHPRRKISRGREPIPLDELLNNSFDETTIEVNEDTISNFSSRSDILERTRTKLQKEESRVAHLTTLLADSEKDLARMQQLNDMLKEEVRRHQRSIEREQHIQNSEYLKNIVIKFVTLANGDEKQQLIPVLNTILKLNPSELQVLHNACKGGWGLWSK